MLSSAGRSRCRRPFSQNALANCDFAEPPYRNGTQRNIQSLQLARVKLLPAEWLLKAAGDPRDKNMSDWLHSPPVGAMALIAFGVTYLVPTVIYVLVMALAVGERARSFKAVSPGMLPPLGIIFGLFVAFTACACRKSKAGILVM